MTTILKNDLITVEPISNDHWDILYQGKTAGEFTLTKRDNRNEISFFINPDYRKKHLAANALYLLTPYIHQYEHIPYIHAVIDQNNTMAKHVLEHNGYAIISKDDQHIYYAHKQYETRKDDDYHPQGKEVIYFAGGCFWGTERIFQMLNGVSDTTTGYANGHLSHPTYEEVCRNETGYRETVRVTYDPAVISLNTLLDAYFLCIDPTEINGQGEDKGEQYQTGVYYRNPDLLPVIEHRFNEEKKKYSSFHVELKPLECFYEAEEYHQDYLIKNPNGFCHITKANLEKVRALNNKSSSHS